MFFPPKNNNKNHRHSKCAEDVSYYLINLNSISVKLTELAAILNWNGP